MFNQEDTLKFELTHKLSKKLVQSSFSPTQNNPLSKQVSKVVDVGEVSGGKREKPLTLQFYHLQRISSTKIYCN